LPTRWLNFTVSGQNRVNSPLLLKNLPDFYTCYVERDRISKYERGTLEPPLVVLLGYAEAANVYMEAIVDARMNLPEKLPCKTKSIGIGAKHKNKIG